MFLSFTERCDALSALNSLDASTDTLFKDAEFDSTLRKIAEIIAEAKSARTNAQRHDSQDDSFPTGSDVEPAIAFFVKRHWRVELVRGFASPEWHFDDERTLQSHEFSVLTATGALSGLGLRVKSKTPRFAIQVTSSRPDEELDTEAALGEDASAACIVTDRKSWLFSVPHGYALRVVSNLKDEFSNHSRVIDLRSEAVAAPPAFFGSGLARARWLNWDRTIPAEPSAMLLEKLVARSLLVKVN